MEIIVGLTLGLSIINFLVVLGQGKQITQALRLTADQSHCVVKQAELIREVARNQVVLNKKLDISDSNLKEVLQREAH